MIGVKVNEDQLKQQLNRLRRVAARVRDTDTPNRQIATELYGFVMKNFQTEGGMTEAGAWEPLADSTVEWKEKQGYSMILQNTGALRQSFMPFSTRELAGVGAVEIVGAKDDRPVDIAKVHEFGLGDVPARPMLPTYEQAVGIGIRVYDVWVKDHVLS